MTDCAGLAGVSLCCCLLLLAGCGESGDDPEPGDEAVERSTPSVLLVTFDTTRADRIGVYGYDAAQTPTLEALADRGLVFEKAWAPAPLTLPSHTSMLTGVYPSAHGVHINGVNKVAEQGLLVSEVLSRRGYRTGAFVGSFVLNGKFGLDQGFDRYSAPGASELSGSSENRLERPAAEVVDDALRWLGTVGADELFFAWVHFNDPHAPYAPVEPYRSQLADAYDGEIATCDGELGRLLAGLSAAGRGDDLLVIVTSDHGESFGEFGERSHGLFVYDATMRVPLIVAMPGSLPGSGRRVDAPVSVTDIPATILEVTNTDSATMPAVQVPSLLAAARHSATTDGGGGRDNGWSSPRTADRSLYIETMMPWDSHHWHPLRGVVWQGHKLIDSPRPELYALPDEQRDLSSEDPELLARFQDRLAGVLSQHQSLGWGEEQAVSAVDRAQLAALGYTGLVAGGGDPFDPSLPVPRDRVGDLVILEEGIGLVESSQRLLTPLGKSPAEDEARREQGLSAMERAREVLQLFRQRNPGDIRSSTYLGYCEMALGHYARAIEPLEQHALAVPNSPQTRYNLAICYWAAGQQEWALSEMAKAVFVDPQADPAYRWLADRKLDAGRPGEALWWLQELQRVWKASANDHAALSQRIGSVAGAAQRAGQEATAPADYPPSDLTPEGRRGKNGR